MKRFFALCITTIMLPSFFYSCMAQSKKVLTAVEFEKEIAGKENIQLLDVRTPGEFFSGHLKNAMLADWNNKSEFDRRINFIDKTKPVYIYCLGGGRSSAAAAKMEKLGFENIIELKGGINAWKAANLPLDGQSNEKQLSIEDFKNSITAHKTVLVDFGAAWCPPCKTMEPVLKSLEENNKGKFVIVKVDGGRDEDILKEYKVTALPVFIIFKDGKQVWRKDGIATEEEMASHL